MTFVASKFGVIVADPPWPFGDSLPGESRGAAKNYRTTMGIDKICGVLLPPTYDDAFLVLWRVAAMVEEAYQVVRAWGFTPKSEIVWQKLTKHGKPWMGMGHSVRASHETAIIATRGRPKPLSRSERSVLAAPVPVGPDGKYIHSAKPDEFYGKVMRLMGGPYLELFARRRRANWTCVGDQAPRARTIRSWSPAA